LLSFIRKWRWIRKNRRKGFSIICAYNDEKKLNDFLVKSLEEQDAPYECIFIDTRSGRHTCAAATLNRAANKANFDHLIFVHQDVAFLSPTWLSEVRITLATFSNPCIAGVAGKCRDGKLYASVYHGTPFQFVGNEKITQPVPVETLDGCLLIVPRKLFKKQRFDAETCTGWHLYVADYCLSLGALGFEAFVLPNEILHESIGPANPSVYESTRQAIARKHASRLNRIHTTIGDWDTETRA